jgi:N6-L-threonylcarbamoyladenine synthase
MILLSIDTSCDETSVAVTRGTSILSNTISSQVDEHAVYGGVVPFLAQRLHRERIDAVIELSLQEAGIARDAIDAIAVTYGPGLAPALEVGVEWARKLAVELDKPLYAINHMAGHIASGYTDREPQYPVMALLLSGGHSELVLIEEWNTWQVLGATLDDAIGEAYDKVAKLLGLGYPGGRLVAEAAARGNDQKYELPVPMKQHAGYNLSYSGLKNAVRLLVLSLGGAEQLSQEQIADVAASFERVAQEAVLIKVARALREYPDIRQLAFGGGVAANTRLRGSLQKLCNEAGVELIIPASFSLCTDNAAMIGLAAHFGIEAGMQPVDPGQLERNPGLVLGA